MWVRSGCCGLARRGVAVYWRRSSWWPNARDIGFLFGRALRRDIDHFRLSRDDPMILQEFYQRSLDLVGAHVLEVDDAENVDGRIGIVISAHGEFLAYCKVYLKGDPCPVEVHQFIRFPDATQGGSEGGSEGGAVGGDGGGVLEALVPGEFGGEGGGEAGGGADQHAGRNGSITSSGARASWRNRVVQSNSRVEEP